MGIEPHIWGPTAWATIHLICLGAPDVLEADQLSYKKFFDALPYVLPCEKCRKHLIQHLEKHPMDAALAGGKSTLFAWSVDLHNEVNVMLGKPTMSVQDALKFWSTYKPSLASCKDTKNKNKKCSSCTCEKVLLYTIFIILGVVIGLLLSKALYMA